MRFLPVESRAEFLVIAIKMVVKSQKLVGYFIPWNGYPSLRKDIPSLQRRQTFSRIYNISKAVHLSLRSSSSFSSSSSRERELRRKSHWGRSFDLSSQALLNVETRLASLNHILFRREGNLQLYGLRTAPRRGYSIFNHEFFDSKEVLIFRNFALVPFTRNEIGFDSTDISDSNSLLSYDI